MGKPTLATSHASSSLQSSLSSSLTSIPNATHPHLHSASSTNQLISSAALPPAKLNVHQLIDQIRNDLSVCFQIFQQSQFTAGNFDSFIPTNQAVIVSQLMDRMIIFDYISNQHGLGGPDSVNGPGLAGGSYQVSNEFLVCSSRVFNLCLLILEYLFFNQFNFRKCVNNETTKFSIK